MTKKIQLASKEGKRGLRVLSAENQRAKFADETGYGPLLL
jgi:hypothetical protein